MKKEILKTTGVKIAVSLLILCISFFGVARVATNPESYRKTITTLDEKKATVMGLTAASTAVSAGISALPGDAASSIADQLAQFSSYFLVILCAIFLEKYLLTITGFVAFKVLIPVACVLYIFNIFMKNEVWKNLIKKLVVLGLVIVMVVPTGVKVANMIDDTQKASIENTIEAANQISDAALGEEGNDTEEQEDGGILDFFSGLATKVTDGLTGGFDYVKDTLNRFIEAIAILIVTSCIIPILTMFCFVWLIKTILGINVNLNVRLPKRTKHAGHLPEKKTQEIEAEKQYEAIETKKDEN